MIEDIERRLLDACDDRKPADSIAETIAGGLSPDKAEAVGRRLVELAKRKKQQAAG